MAAHNPTKSKTATKIEQIEKSSMTVDDEEEEPYYDDDDEWDKLEPEPQIPCSECKELHYEDDLLDVDCLVCAKKLMENVCGDCVDDNCYVCSKDCAVQAWADFPSTCRTITILGGDN